MGLDIYFHHVARQFEGDQSDNEQFNQFCEQVDADAKERLRGQIDKLLKPLREAWENAQTNDYWVGIYNERYFTFVEKLRPIIAKNYDWIIRPYTDKILTLPELEEQVKKEVDGYYEQYDVYFRKVNFLFAYFQNKGKMVDEYYAFVDKEDVDDIIDRCEQILAAKKGNELLEEGETVEEFAASLLPTQSGFFFGSTDYNDWYFYDVKDCLKQMKAFLKLFKDSGTGYVIFSW